MSDRLVLEPIAEYQQRRIPAPPPTEADLALADQLTGAGRQPKLVVRWLAGGEMEVAASSWVGVVRFSGVQVSVVPKLAGGNLGVLRMLQYVSGLDLLRGLEGQDLPGIGENLFDLLCLLLADETKRVLRDGLLLTSMYSLSCLSPTARPSARSASTWRSTRVFPSMAVEWWASSSQIPRQMPAASVGLGRPPIRSQSSATCVSSRWYSSSRGGRPRRGRSCSLMARRTVANNR